MTILRLKFYESSDAHLIGQQCKKCQNGKSIGENKIIDYLNLNNIKFEPHKKFDDLKSPLTNYHLYMDFYLKDYNMCIEFNGRQHYEMVDFSSNGQNLKEKLSIQQFNDKTKKEYCEKNYIKLLVIPHWRMPNIDTILKDNIWKVHYIKG